MSKQTHKTFKFRLYPSKAQGVALTNYLSEACRFYNAALQERRDAWKLNRVLINFYSQDAQLKDIRAAGDIGIPNFVVARDVLRRVDRAFQGFFRRMKQGEKAGYPRFKSYQRYDSLGFPAYGDGCKLIGSKLRVQGVGLIRIKLHRPTEGKIKTAMIKREADKWYVCFTTVCDIKPLPESCEEIGLDMGLTAFATLSDGTEISNPRYHRKAQAKLKRAQRKVSQRKLGSHRRRKAALLLQKAHAHIKNQRADFHHKISRWFVNDYGLIVVEDLNIKGMVKNHNLAKSIHDAGWSTFIIKLAEKAESAARTLIKVNPCGTSQTCLCGAEVRKTLADRWHECESCGLSAPRDVVSAQVILARGLRAQAIT